ncbi:hypothetical protein FIBSPDRAFT_1036723 [Athelia psychrophila]|uniref:Uncharacterized protein n=1 Tax=Athelia psychrophila TaxID=1759441 RepID=A0A166VCC6_9AGAM|nr:hypothetical protein FIBSPDRAFT_1036723 [Fibularhizoctonia sp. CBS 109695]
MRQISEARRQRALSLSERLEEIASARLKLPAELDNLDAQERAVRLERSILHNLDAPTSDIPDELLAMIFEADEDIPLSQGFESHVGALASHVSHRWRKIALSTPRLWSRIRYVAGSTHMEEFHVYLSRSKMAPVDIYIDAYGHSALVTDLPHLVANHIGHCRWLCIENVERETLQQLLEYTSSQPAPILTFLKIQGHNGIHFSGPLFASAAPRLRVLDLQGLELNTIQIPWISVFKAVTHLRLDDIYITNSETYSSFRCILGTLKSLSHLELQPLEFPIPLPPQPPLELPNLQFLHVDSSAYPQTLDIILHNIRASSLTSLSLIGWDINREDSLIQGSLLAQSHFPSLRHLIISGFMSKFCLLAEALPDIERLTCGPAGVFSHNKNFHTMLAEINSCATLAWPKLERIAVSRMYSHVVIDLALRNTFLNLQQAGRPLHKLMLPQEYISGTDTMALALLREVVEIEPFNDDWPTPFETLF